jgi:hypothetical protein
MPDTTTDAFAIAAGLFEDMITLRDFMRDKVRPVVERFDKERDGTVRGLFLRAQGWLGTLAELKEPQHFQAALAGTRTLLEIAIDLALLHHDRTSFTPAKMVAWERSAKLRAAERTQTCFAGRPLPPEHQPRIDFVNNHGAAIRVERAALWPGRKRPDSHPDRWTGRSLDADAKAADRLGGYGLRDYYDGRFAELCWGTHGSGLAGVRFISEDQFPGLIAFAFNDAAWLAVLVSKLTLHYFGQFDGIMEERFKLMEADRKKWRAIAVGQAKGRIERS